MFHYIDIKAMESPAVMYSVQKDLESRWGLLCKTALESALEFPSVKDMARKALAAR
jgi:hypothetical protein